MRMNKSTQKLLNNPALEAYLKSIPEIKLSDVEKIKADLILEKSIMGHIKITLPKEQMDELKELITAKGA